VIVPPATIICVECGGPCGLLQEVGPEDELEPGDVVAYRCGDCQERFDVVLTEDDDPDVAGEAGFGPGPGGTSGLAGPSV
jgi:hypothetical protein